MAIATLDSHIYAALTLLEKQSSAYLAIGKPTPWQDDNNPPLEDPKAKTLIDVIGYKKVKNFSLARPIRDGEDPASLQYPTVQYGNTTWVLIPAEQAYVQEAHWLYIDAELLAEDFPPGEYRQVGIHLDLVPHSGVTKLNLLPNEVQNIGHLHFYSNRTPQNRTENVHILEQFIART
ncbi:virion structural protein [Bacillus phage Shbh1]|uniref:Putative structural protein n=1 Tax=Bacillus phage Shbh1 TaxID=1796992 RepID=A0A142F1F8_9CAUD|nr:virion structural protein [Bacillus phage Shbh1]AMQ66615.1 putative structural protein [Bacillus phage Shbh1]